MMKYIILLLLSIIKICPSIAQNDYENKQLYPKKIIIHGNTYKHDSISNYYFSKDSVYDYEPIQKVFIKPKSIEEWKEVEEEIDNLLDKFPLDDSTFLLKTHVPQSIYYNRFIDSLNIKYEEIKKLSNFYNLSNGEICNLAQYCNAIDRYMLENKIMSKYKNKNPKYWIIPKIAKDYKVKFDSLFNDFCRKNRQSYYLEKPKALFTQTLRVAGDGGFEVLIDFYKTCPIKSEFLKDEKVIILKPYTTIYCVVTMYGYGTPNIIGWSKEK
ncbi:hypothetical protein Fleli_3651 [Bernardetia litoralis DSM 6794]|uniref:ADP-ribosyltransferase exoenzyme n=1 Tax=Bernardetia litoralis (strain ATCC 23117 / DSM 6794 / NBRC 15988 / NCIMB 1366 / Fx l1 / Sio-4) TaxID=880071 RepID=I4APT1_BERLS|nr:hypothetical protein [Bernardetia litoralis]AFM05966.1 hypothetical protein Fleli_3651 [Bernardetia litoralis DSM 6794]